MPDLEAFATEHGLGIVHISDLVQYRLARELLVHLVTETNLRPTGAGLRATTAPACTRPTWPTPSTWRWCWVTWLGRACPGAGTDRQSAARRVHRDPAGRDNSTHRMAAGHRAAGTSVLLYILPLGSRHIATALNGLSASAAQEERAISRGAATPRFPHALRTSAWFASAAPTGVRAIRLLTNIHAASLPWKDTVYKS